MEKYYLTHRQSSYDDDMWEVFDASDNQNGMKKKTKASNRFCDAECRTLVDNNRRTNVGNDKNSSPSQVNKVASLCRRLGYVVTALALPFALVTYMNRQENINANGNTTSSSLRSENVALADVTPRRAFVCITGQLSRLELQNKIATVLEPLRTGLNLDTDIALLLDPTISFTTNSQRVEANYHPLYESYDQAVGELRSYGYNVLTDAPYVQVDPMVPQSYLDHLNRRASFDDAKHLERAQNNIRMLETWSQCYNVMSQDIERMGTYDIVVRLREDSGFLNAIDMKQALQDLRANPKRIISNGCRAEYGGNGMNDKFGVMLPGLARQHFQLPFYDLYSRPIGSHVKSSETLIHSSYTNAGLDVSRSEFILDAIKIVSDEEGNYRLFDQEKKKLKKNCGIDVEDDDLPMQCTVKWHKQTKKMVVNNKSCWPNKRNPSWKIESTIKD